MASPRIIAGAYKGRRLKSVPGDVTRPITDRVKEALFNVLGVDIVGSAFLDLFGGTGSVGIEALSRGADFVLFLEKNNLAYKVLLENLTMVTNQKKFMALQADAFSVVRKPMDKKFDYIFIAPPQFKGMWKDMLKEIDQQPALMTPDAWVIVQIAPSEYEEIPLTRLKEFDQRDYGSTRLVFYIND